MFRRQTPEPTQEETISEELLATIPDLGNTAEQDEEVIELEAAPTEASENDAPQPPAPNASVLAAQLRFEMGEAFGRELDRAEAAVAAAVADLEGRLAQALDDAAAARAEAEAERKGRITAEERLQKFRDLALR